MKSVNVAWDMCRARGSLCCAESNKFSAASRIRHAVRHPEYWFISDAPFSRLRLINSKISHTYDMSDTGKVSMQRLLGNAGTAVFWIITQPRSVSVCGYKPHVIPLIRVAYGLWPLTSLSNSYFFLSTIFTVSKKRSQSRSKCIRRRLR